ncbi:hypothetical protein IC619_002795 [Hazenella sp. IB182353]|uniref:hypothetical protein n=1 Tax=Polycladospora coralii TaxID=2771432 RepID=UPI001746C592|nr:hypothetical protein [Polycladospora coralii]MBS7529425.1 hypothetical protein [Polycladospora coralii]
MKHLINSFMDKENLDQLIELENEVCNILIDDQEELQSKNGISYTMGLELLINSRKNSYC